MLNFVFHEINETIICIMIASTYSALLSTSKAFSSDSDFWVYWSHRQHMWPHPLRLVA